jgi:Cu2+-exporting ATPase
MTHTYSIFGMTSDHCVSKVQKALEAINGIPSAQVNLDPPQAVITMHHHVSTEELNAALSAVGDYRITPQTDSVITTKDHLAELTEHGHEAATSKDNHQGMDHSKMDHSDHGDHHRMMIEDFKRRFLVSLILMLPVLLLAPMIQNFLGVTWTFPGDRYVQFVLSSIIYFYGGWPFLKGLKEELGKRTPGMMTLIAVAITAAYVYSSAVVFGLEGKTFFWELASLIVVMLLGHWIEMRSVLGASKAWRHWPRSCPTKLRVSTATASQAKSPSTN